MDIIKKLRKRKSLTCEELGSLVGVHGQTINKAENGKTDFGAITLLKVIKACGYRIVLVPDEMIGIDAEVNEIRIPTVDIDIRIAGEYTPTPSQPAGT